MGVGRAFTGVLVLILVGDRVGVEPWCCMRRARLLLEKEGVGTSAAIAA